MDNFATRLECPTRSMMVSIRCIYVNIPIGLGRVNTTPCLSTTEAILPGHRDQQLNTMTVDTETTPAYITAV